MMNHCIDCGKRISRGRCASRPDAYRCLVCKVKRDMRGWRFESAAMKRRREAKDKCSA
jgi:RNA polymerase-binding transcription factor DksA